MTDKTIAELCAPLSAKVMPRGYAFSMGGIEMTREEQIEKQRRSTENRHNVSLRKDRKRKVTL